MLGGRPTGRSGAASIIQMLFKFRRLLAHPSIRAILDDWCGAGFSAALDVVMSLFAIVLAADDFPFQRDGTSGPDEDVQIEALGAKRTGPITYEVLDRVYRATLLQYGVEK